MSAPLVALLPAFPYLAGLVAPDRARERAAQLLRDRAARGSLRFEDGGDHKGGAALADAIAAGLGSGSECLVVGRPWHARAAEWLVEELDARGIPVRAVLDEEELTRRLGLAWPAVALEPGEIELSRAAPSRAELDGLVARTRRAADEHGARSIRLVPVPATERDPRIAGSPWALRLGWNRPGWTDAMRALVARALPHQRLPLDVALGHLAQATAPLEELWAGNGIAERNAELLANVLPEPARP